MEKERAIVVGAGIIGLVTAFRLARSGFDVTIFDSSPAQGATWAAAGMVAPQGEITAGEYENFLLQQQALESWQLVRDEIQELVDHRITIQKSGTLYVGWDAGDRRLLDQFLSVATSFSSPIQRVQRNTQTELFAELSPRITEGALLETDAWINPDEVVAALQLSLNALGVKIVNETVSAVSEAPDTINVVTAGGRYEASFGVLCTGADQLPEGAPFPQGLLRPVRGFTVRIAGLGREGLPMVRAFIRGRNFYLVSRENGYGVLGASVEERREKSVEMGELQRLLRDGLDLVPSLETASVLEQRVGLRPASEDAMPFFLTSNDGRWAWSSGHYRHGVTLAPLAANDALNFGHRQCK